MSELMLCPFCGCSIAIRKFIYPNGEEGLELYGYHEENCIFDVVIWSVDPEDGWTEDKLAEVWNWQLEKGERK